MTQSKQTKISDNIVTGSSLYAITGNIEEHTVTMVSLNKTLWKYSRSDNLIIGLMIIILTTWAIMQTIK